MISPNDLLLGLSNSGILWVHKSVRSVYILFLWLCSNRACRWEPPEDDVWRKIFINNVRKNNQDLEALNLRQMFYCQTHSAALEQNQRIQLMVGSEEQIPVRNYWDWGLTDKLGHDDDSACQDVRTADRGFRKHGISSLLSVFAQQVQPEDSSKNGKKSKYTLNFHEFFKTIRKTFHTSLSASSYFIPSYNSYSRWESSLSLWFRGEGSVNRLH